MKLSTITSSEQVRYELIQVSKDNQFVQVKNLKTGVLKDFQIKWLKKMQDEGNIIEHDDDTFSFAQTERKIEY